MVDIDHLACIACYKHRRENPHIFSKGNYIWAIAINNICKGLFVCLPIIAGFYAVKWYIKTAHKPVLGRYD